MAPRAVRAAVAAAGLALAACGGGGGTARPPVPTSTDTRTVTLPAAAVSGLTGSVAKPPFPAGSPEDVLALAGLRPDGKVAYDVTGGPQGDETVVIARRGARALVRRTDADGAATTVGISIPDGAITFTCSGAADAPRCAAGDPQSDGVHALQDVAGLLGGNTIDAAFASLASAPADEVGLGQDQQVGLDVSCLAGSGPAGDLRLCVTERGTITELTSGGRHAVATAVADVASAADVARPDGSGGEGAPASGGTSTDGAASDAGSTG